jgi:hypothetical protein
MSPPEPRGNFQTTWHLIMPHLWSHHQAMVLESRAHEPHAILKQRPSPAMNRGWKLGILFLLLLLLARPSLAVLAATSGSEPSPQQPLREPPPAVNSTSQVQQQAQQQAAASCRNTALPPFSGQDPPPPPLPPREAGPGIGEVAWLVLPWLDGNSLVQVAIPWAACGFCLLSQPVKGCATATSGASSCCLCRVTHSLYMCATGPSLCLATARAWPPPRCAWA